MLNIVGSTVTASDPVLSLAQTWNKGSVTFTAFNLTVTNTASAAASLLMNLNVGGTSRIHVDESGDVMAHGSMNINNTTTGYVLNGTFAMQFSSAIPQRALRSLLAMARIANGYS